MDSAAQYRADLHVHSRCSENPANPFIRALGGRESYTDPLHVYRAARSRGMDFVTITDHNTLAGSLAIAHLPGTFLSCEFDTWFPDDRVKVHVVALGIDEETFAEANAARESIFDLVACLRSAKVVHYLAHPLFDMTGRMTVANVEQLLLLFNTMEARNGARVDRNNCLLERIALSLTPQAVAEMAERQGVEPWGDAPWRKALTGGSDDHSGLFVAAAHTVAGGDGTVQGFLAAVAAGDCRPGGEHGDARLLAHSIYAGAFHHVRGLLRLDDAKPRRRLVSLMNRGFRGIGTESPLLDKAISGVRACAPGLYRDGDPRGPAWEALLQHEVGSLLETPEGLDGVSPVELNRRLFVCARQLADDVARHHWHALVATEPRRSARQKLIAAFGVGMVHFLELPYFVAWGVQSRDRAGQHELRGAFLGREPLPGKLAVFSDGLTSGTDGSTAWTALRAYAADRGMAVERLTASPLPTLVEDGVAHFEALVVRPQGGGAHYAGPIPSAIEMLDHLERGGFTAAHIVTSDVFGLAGALAARLLHLPASAYADGASAHGSLLYKLVDVVFVPTPEVLDLLVAHGVARRSVRVLEGGEAGSSADATALAVVTSALLPPRSRHDGHPHLTHASARAAELVQEFA